jgi:hypothetical protein
MKQRGASLLVVVVGAWSLSSTTTKGAPGAPPSAAMDELVDHTCGSDPLERKIAGRLDRAKLGERELVAVRNCTNWAFSGDLASPLPIKALKLLDVKAEASFRKCLADEKIRDPKIIETLTGYVRAAFDGDASDRRMQQEYAGCYANVLRCRQHPCPAAHAGTGVSPSLGPLRVSVKLLAAAGGRENAGRLAPVPADAALKTGDKVAFQITTSRPAYVYIVQKAAHGRLNVLFPDPLIPTYNPIKASSLRLPPAEHFVLDRESGRETVFVVASLHEQADLGARLANVGDQHALSKALVDVAAGAQPAKRPAVEGEDAVMRGLVLASRVSSPGGTASGDGPSAHAQAAPGDDTVVMQLGFSHLPEASE